jgi:hypothetical protein
LLEIFLLLIPGDGEVKFIVGDQQCLQHEAKLPGWWRGFSLLARQGSSSIKTMACHCRFLVYITRWGIWSFSKQSV